MPPRQSRIGLALFSFYLLLYGGFVLLAAFSPTTMEPTPLAGVNFAIWYGFGLIVAAIVMALIYGWTSRTSATPSNEPNPLEVVAARRGRDDPARSSGGDA